ncbi:hypothetical protein F511_44520 [Dorcoceras hygrometricum]|uniref:Uncharacterized protein n=1 Tax=Dorcoceras hygrometricum TaxID=472368 RepID=A0A2Z7BKC4_9LAMI|nr:hypothetical protein F511_44520 [Dorcoceras hygrometricum]
MVTPGSRQAKGYAIQICVLLRNVPGLELGESKSFPVPRILNEKTVHRFISVNENVGIKEVADAPRARRTPVKTTVSKKRPATGDDEVAPIIKKKRTTKGKPVAVKRLMVEEPDTAISTSGEPVAEDATVFKHQDADRREKADTWFDEAFDEEFEIANKERQVSEEVIDVTIEEGTGERSMSRKLGELSSIGDKGKAILVEDDQITENPASKIVALICRDVEVLVRVRDSVMKAVVDFFASFSLNTMPDTESLKDLKEKEKLMMEWAETNTLATAVRRQIYLELDQPWTDMAVQVINLLSAAHSQSLEDLKAQQQEHKIEMIVDYIRGGDAKKGEGGSSSRPPPVRVERRPLPTPQSPRDVVGGSSAVRTPTFPRTTGTFAERAEQARRHILESGQAITLEEAAERVVRQIFRSQIECKEKEIGKGEKREVVPLKGDEDFD